MNLRKKKLETEVKVSTYLQGKLPVQVPLLTPLVSRFQKETDEVGNIHFTVTPYLKGRDLWNIYASQPSVETKKRFERQLTDIVIALHALPETEINQLNLPTYNDKISERIQNYSEFQKQSPENQKELLGKMHRLLCESTARQVLCHNDLGAQNILVDTQKGSISALLDFGEALQAPPMVDFIKLSTYETAPTMRQYYRHKTGVSLNPVKIAQHKETIPLFLDMCAQLEKNRQHP